jgi:glycosyltransferase involved in cell wall biosynthesis
MRLLLFNLVTDVDDPILGFATRWIEALAQHVEFIHVITMRAGRMAVPDNVRVYSVGKEKGYSEPRRAVEFYQHVYRMLREDRIDVCFSHMMPIFSALAAPLLKLRGIPIITWYAHPSLTSVLKMAHYVSRWMVTSIESAYPYKHDKLIVVGQGIDTDLFTPHSVCPEEPPIILCVGRLSSVKDHPTLLKAAALLRKRLGRSFRIVIIGGAATLADEAYIRFLHKQVQALGLQDMVCLEASVPNSKLPYWYRRCAVHVNLTPTGFGDKVAWEAMSCGRPCLAANAGFAETFGAYKDSLLFQYRDPEDLAQKLEVQLQLSPEERMALGVYLRQRVMLLHGLNRLTDKLIAIFHEVTQEHVL